MASVSSKIHVIDISKTFVGIVDITINLNVNLSRFESQIHEAQKHLDVAVLEDSNYFAPELNGVLKNTGRTTPGSGVVEWIQIYSRYLYYGKVMVDAATGKGPMHYIDKYGNEVIRFRKGAKLIPTSKKLKIQKSVNPNASKEWFKVAKLRNGATWVRDVKRIAGGG